MHLSSEPFTASPNPPSTPLQGDPLTDALDLLAWFSTRDWAQITRDPDVARRFSRQSTYAAILVETARAQLPVFTTPITICCHNVDSSEQEEINHDHTTQA